MLRERHIENDERKDGVQLDIPTELFGDAFDLLVDGQSLNVCLWLKTRQAIAVL